jgi:phosphoribosylglycinamide formyltransferase-1
MSGKPQTDRMRLGFLASHGGTNLQAVLDACASGELSATPAVLVTNNRGAHCITRAQAAGVAVHVLNGVTHPEPDDLDAAMLEALRSSGCEWIVLAGYMKKIGPRVLEAFAGRMINIHPALLPRHGGQGMFGMNVHRAVIAAGDAVSGATVHLVDGEYDEGPVLAQAEVPVLPGDTPETLAARVLETEHRLLVATLCDLATKA